jgi:hypothetical protein
MAVIITAVGQQAGLWFVLQKVFASRMHPFTVWPNVQTFTSESFNLFRIALFHSLHSLGFKESSCSDRCSLWLQFYVLFRSPLRFVQPSCFCLCPSHF